MLIGALALMVLSATLWSEQFPMGGLGLIGSLFLALVISGSVEPQPARCRHSHLIEWCGPCQAARLRTVGSMGDVLHADDPERRGALRVA